MPDSSTPSPPSPALRRTRLVTALIGAVLAAGAGWLGLFRMSGPLVFLSYDLPFIAHRAGGADEIRIVHLDRLDGDRLDRRVQAELLDKLNEAGALAVVYDVIFDLPSADPAVDQAFAAAIRRFRGVDETGAPVPGAPRRSVILACGRESIGQTGALGERLIPPADDLLDAADDFGLVAFVHDKNFTVRELATGSPDEPSLAWKAAIAAGTKLDEAERLAPRWINFAGPPCDPADPHATPAIRSCTASNVLAGAEPGFFRNKIVVVGGKPGIAGRAAGIDLFSTPFHRFHHRGDLALMGGVELQANVLANLHQGNWITRTEPRAEFLFILAAGALAGFGLAWLRPGKALAAALLAVVALALAGTLAIHYQRLWFPWSVAAFAQVPVALGWSAVSNFYVERHFRLRLTEQQRRMREAFALYLSPRMIDQLIAADFDPRMRGQRATVAIMFTDIATYTDMCQRVKDPEQIVETLKDYFQRTTAPVFDHDGVIIQFVGDAIFAAWGTPLTNPFPDPAAAVKAVRAAWQLFTNDKLVVEGVDMATRIGLHYGEVVAGNIGSDRHIDYGLVGDAVNLTSRIESLNKLFGTRILVSGEIRSQIGHDFRTRRVGRFRVKGREEATELHELLGPARQETEPGWITDYHAALAALEAGDRAAATLLFQAADSGRIGGDAAARFFLDLLERNEPIDGGVVKLDEK